MNAVRHRASVAPSTVTRLSKGEVKPPRRKRTGKRIVAVKDEQVVKVDERIMAMLREQDVDFRCVEVVSATEVIIHNQRVR